MIEIFIKNLIEASLIGSLGIVLIIALRKTLFKKYTNSFSYYIWLAVIFKMIVPFKLTINIPERISSSIEHSPSSVQTIINSGIYLNQETGIKSSINKVYSNTHIVNYFEIIFYLWLAISVLFLVYHIISYYIFNKKIRAISLNVTDTEIKKIYSNLLAKMNIKKKICLKICSGISTPLGIGFFNSCILLPDVSYKIEELEYILRHELMHYKRFDMFYKMLLLLTMAIHWFNPLVYIMYKEIGNDCEFSCDEAVLKNSNIDERKFYALTLVNSLRLNKNNTVKQNLIMEFNNKDILKRRLDSMLNLKIRKKGILIGIITILITVSSLVTINIFAKDTSIKENSKTAVNSQLLQPQQVIENYFKYLNEKNKEALLTTVTEHFKSPNVVWGLENLEYTKINSISKSVNSLDKDTYMKAGHGSTNSVKEENVKIYNVNYTVKYKTEEFPSHPSGNYIIKFIVIRKDMNSPWLIDDLGE